MVIQIIYSHYYYLVHAEHACAFRLCGQSICVIIFLSFHLLVGKYILYCISYAPLMTTVS